MARKRDSPLALPPPEGKQDGQAGGDSFGSERDFQTFFELSDVGNVITDAETSHFLKVNRRFCDLTGYSAKELRTLTPRDITHPEDRARDQIGWEECLDQGASHFQIEKRYLRKNGSVIWVSVTSTIVRGDDGLPLHAIGVVMDISEKKFLERALLEAAEREQRRIGQDLHDHLCQHLLGAAFATKALAGELDKEGSKASPQLHDLARLISEAVSQVRDISRGLHPVELDSEGLMSALQELANRVNHMIPCEFICKENVLVSDSNSALQAYRIVQDAVASALQQTGAKKITIRLAENERAVCLEVTDDGTRESELTADQSSLSAKIMHYRMNAIGGELSIKHPKGKGTRVICAFPKSS